MPRASRVGDHAHIAVPFLFASGPVAAKQEVQLMAIMALAPEITPESLGSVEEPLGRLATHIRSCFEAAVNHRNASGVTERQLACQRQRDGLYDPDKLERIRKAGPVDTYHNITDTKCSALKASLVDVLLPVEDKPWALEATPIPDLPEAAQAAVVEQVLSEAMRVRQLMPGAITPGVVRARTMQLYEEKLAEEQEEAKKRAGAAGRLIEDQMAEGDFARAFSDFLEDLVEYPTAVLEGPTYRQKWRGKWINNEYAVVSETVPTWEAASPHDLYPAPTARNPQEGYICKIVEFEARDLSRFRGTEGWKSIEQILDNQERGEDVASQQGSSERAWMESRESPLFQGPWPEGKIRALYFWGPVQGEMLIEWGYAGEFDPYDFYEVCAILIGREVPYAVLNPDPLNERPFWATGVRKKRNSWWHKALPELMKDAQDGYNAAWRSLQINGALASGPMYWYDRAAMCEGEDPSVLGPFRAFAFDSSKTSGFSGRVPMEFFQPSMNANELLAIAAQCEQDADTRTGIPRYSYGDQSVGGAAKTASGLSMLRADSNRQNNQILTNIAVDVIGPMIQYMHRHNLRYSDDPSIKGDVRVVARGALDELLQDSLQMRRQEFLDRTMNDIDMLIVGIEGRRKVYEAVAKGLKIPGVVPSEEELMQRTQEHLMQQQEAMRQERDAQRGKPGKSDEQGNGDRVPGAGASQEKAS